MEKPTKPFRYVKSDRLIADDKDRVICGFNSEAITGYEESICANLIVAALNRDDKTVIDEFRARCDNAFVRLVQSGAGKTHPVSAIALLAENEVYKEMFGDNE